MGEIEWERVRKRERERKRERDINRKKEKRHRQREIDRDKEKERVRVGHVQGTGNPTSSIMKLKNIKTKQNNSGVTCSMDSN